MPQWHHRDGAIKEPSRPMEGDHVVIIGPYGNIWHDGSFQTAEAADEYLRKWWGKGFNPHEWRLACASVTMEAVEPSFRLPSASVDRSPEDGDRETGHHAKHESAVGDAETPNLSTEGDS